jgi:cytochrome c556
MTRWFGAVATALAVVVMTLGGSSADEKGPAAKDVMKAVAGKTGFCAKCAGAVKAGNWAEAQDYAKKMADCGVALTKAPCPKGDAKSWEKLTTQFCAQTAAVNKAAQAKDADAFGTSLKAFTGSCKTCHDAHKQ